MAYLLLVCTLPFQVLDNISSRAQVFHSDKVHLTNLIVSVFLHLLIIQIQLIDTVDLNLKNRFLAVQFLVAVILG